MPRFDRDVAPRQYEARLRELEREVRMLRADREGAMRRGPDRRETARQLYRERPPARYADQEMRERERYAVSQRAPRRPPPRDRYSNDD